MPNAPTQRLVFPLDFPGGQEALRYVSLLKGLVGWFKVGLELFVSEGPAFLLRLREKAPESRIFLDLKLHDIPVTVARATARARELGAELLTVHAQGGAEMLKAATSEAGQTKILAVTLLTSLDAAQMAELRPEYQESAAYAEFLAKKAIASGCHGLVASSREIMRLRKCCGKEPLLVIPGIRPAWAEVASDDQKRVDSPFSALSQGADLLVVGRPIRDAADPAEAAALIAQEIGTAMHMLPA
jgi:orotidine-5'-phosphate decarboxylase